MFEKSESAPSHRNWENLLKIISPAKNRCQSRSCDDPADSAVPPGAAGQESRFVVEPLERSPGARRPPAHVLCVIVTVRSASEFVRGRRPSPWKSTESAGLARREQSLQPVGVGWLERVESQKKDTHARPGKIAASMPTSRPWCVNAWFCLDSETE